MKKNKGILLFVGCILVLLMLYRINPKDNTTISNDVGEENKIDPRELRTSGNWELTSIILIDGDATGVDAHNWTWAVAQEWCSGSGTEANPYLLENITITVDNESAGLTIKDSGVHFKLNNISITNGGNGDGLELIAISNGTIISSEFNSNNNSGIIMNNVNDTSITLTTCLNNTIDGIYAVDSNLNTFTVDCINNTRYGLMLASSDNNTVILSEFTGNVEIGLAIVELGEDDSLNNKIYSNTFENNTINGLDNCSVANTWDNGVSLGNNWDDYTGKDTNDDLIGDTPYDISGSAEAQDNYPYCNDGKESKVRIYHRTTGEDRDLWDPITIETFVIMVIIIVSTLIGFILLSKLLFKL